MPEPPRDETERESRVVERAVHVTAVPCACARRDVLRETGPSVSLNSRKGFRENVVSRSSSPIHILYNHAASGGPRSL